MKLPRELTPEQLESICMSYDHAFLAPRQTIGEITIAGYTEKERNALRFKVKEMYSAIRKELSDDERYNNRLVVCDATIFIQSHYMTNEILSVDVFEWYGCTGLLNEFENNTWNHVNYEDLGVDVLPRGHAIDVKVIFDIEDRKYYVSRIEVVKIYENEG